jgi:hypothetical protein
MCAEDRALKIQITYNLCNQVENSTNSNTNTNKYTNTKNTNTKTNNLQFVHPGYRR